MGYDLHLTRKDSWADEEDQRNISLKEWQNYIENDSEISTDPENPGPDNYIFLRDGEDWPLWFQDSRGEIYTKNPPLDVIQKMVRVANTLGAQVRGDDDELYDINGSIIPPTTAPEQHTANHERYVWYFVLIILACSLIWHTIK